MLSIKAGDIMSKKVVAISSGAPLSAVIGKMRKHDVHELPVVEKKKLVGLVSYAGLIRRRKLALSSSVKNLMVRPPQISPEESLVEVAEFMVTNGFRAIPIAQKGKLLGIVSRTDVVRAMRRVKEFSLVPVGRVMTTSPVCISDAERISKASGLMHDMGVRALPVVSDNRLVGVIGLKDVASFLEVAREKSSSGELAGEKVPLDLEVKSVMKTPITVKPRDRLSKAIDLMVEHGISSVVVEEKGKPTGVLTKADLLQILAGTKEQAKAYVQITGLEEEPSVYNAIYELVENSLNKINKLITPRMLLLNFTKYHKEGETSKYSLTAKLSVGKILIMRKTHNWDLMKAVDDVMESLEREVRKRKKRIKTLRQQKSKRLALRG